MSAIDRCRGLAAAEAFRHFGNAVQEVKVDGHVISRAEAERIAAAEDKAVPHALPAWLERATAKKADKHTSSDVDADAPKSKSKLRQTVDHIVGPVVHGAMHAASWSKAQIDKVNVDAIAYHAHVDVVLQGGATQSFELDVTDRRSTYAAQLTKLVSDFLNGCPVPGVSTLVMAPVSLLSGVAALVAGLRGVNFVAKGFGQLALRQLGLGLVGEMVAVGDAIAAGFFVADVRSMNTFLHAPTVNDMNNLSQWAKPAADGSHVVMAPRDAPRA